MTHTVRGSGNASGSRLGGLRVTTRQKWEYHVETFNLTQRFSSGKYAEEVQRLLGQLNAIGTEGWELVTQGEVAMKNHVTGAASGELTVCFFKRPR